MTIREQQEALEHEILSPRATFADETRGRERPEEECPMRTPFQRDRDRILHCNAFRRLTHKTQVFLSPEGSHYRTRLTHTLEVSQIARTLSRALRLNEGPDRGYRPGARPGPHPLWPRRGICPAGCLRPQLPPRRPKCAGGDPAGAGGPRSEPHRGGAGGHPGAQRRTGLEPHPGGPGRSAMPIRSPT